MNRIWTWLPGPFINWDLQYHYFPKQSRWDESVHYLDAIINPEKERTKALQSLYKGKLLNLNHLDCIFKAKTLKKNLFYAQILELIIVIVVAKTFKVVLMCFFFMFWQLSLNFPPTLWEHLCSILKERNNLQLFLTFNKHLLNCLMKTDNIWLENWWMGVTESDLIDYWFQDAILLLGFRQPKTHKCRSV